MRGDRLKRLREQHEYTQTELGDIIGVHKNQITRWESGQATPSVSSLIKLSETFGVTSDYLLGLVSEPNSSVTEDNLNPLERRFISLLRARAFGTIMRMIVDLIEGKGDRD